MQIPGPFDATLARIPQGRHELTVDGVQTCYWSYGHVASESVVILIHGFRGDHHGLESVAAELAAEYLCIVPDLPGFGETSDFLGEASIDAYATWLTNFVADVSGGRTVTIVGHSFGSIIVSAAIAKGCNPRHLVLINPISKNALRGPRAILTRFAIWYYWLGAALPQRTGMWLLKHPAIVRLMSVAMVKSKDKALRRWIHNQHDLYFSNFHSRKAVMQAFTTSVTNDVSMFATALNRPLLLLVAEKDDISDLESQEKLAARLPKSTLKTVPEVGHLVHYEAYEWAANQIRSFMDSDS
jgi:pimeloyl-ACP methyl ester carboxylesterase